ncbi:minor capsid protein [Haloarcula onubensis]|uniref:Minor capsid protein n=1 Tax=Haloarcula onubensis TaxID=2950539 RepID=A0ABU2FVD7_9EURY|nr:minor capsid protein [Halomicroarcula sp. S3CR25-11]MDS0284731.1 minor capsid protein [Halomicroarcula sp. S3CR25-11]
MSACGHDHHELVANEKQDLTKTTTLHRREFAPAVRKRFRLLKGLIRKTVGYTYDALRLTAAEPKRQFVFETRAEAVDQFQQWLEDAVDEDVLEVIERERIRNGVHYTARYVRAAYGKGLRHAGDRLEDAGFEIGDQAVSAMFNMPVHERELETIYTRAYDNLDWITQQMQQSIRSELTEALVKGENPRKVAGRLTDEVDVGISQAETFSRTEISNAHNTASAKRYEDAGVDEVVILTSDPCTVCEALAAGGPYPVDEAASLIPGRTHPNCVCTIAPNV